MVDRRLRMPRRAGRLSARFVATVEEPGRYVDGHGLLLMVKPGGSKSWVFRYQRNGRRREIGLGPVHLVSLAEARRLALDMQRMLHEGRDPFLERRKARARASLTFREAAEAFLAGHRQGWRNPKHRQQWENTLRTYAVPALGDLPVSEVETQHVLAVLEPIWRTRTETAKRLRGRIEAVLDWAAARGMRDGLNPARWRGHLDKLLPRPSLIAPVRHHSALDWRRAPDFFRELVRMPGIAPVALSFLILTAARSGEVRGACWWEIDTEAGVWSVPAERTKAGREHRVPLGPRALALLAGLPRVEGVDPIFPGSRGVMSDMTLSAVIRRMNRRREAEGLDPWRDPHGRSITVQGLRSTFRTWAHEATDFPSEIAEAALGHVTGDRVERAYRRGDALERRRRLTEAWERFLLGRSHPRRPVGRRAKRPPGSAEAAGSRRLPRGGASTGHGAATDNPLRLRVREDGRLVPSSG